MKLFRCQLYGLLMVGMLCLAPIAAMAEQPLVAIILPNDIERFTSIHETFLAEFSASERSQFKLYVQTPNYDMMSLRNSARKAVAIDADIIVVYGSLAASAAHAESLNTPVLFSDVFEPVSLGILKQKNRSTRKMTGIVGNGPPQTLLSFFRETRELNQLLAVYSRYDSSGKIQVDYLQKIAGHQKVAVETLALDNRADIMEQLSRAAGQYDAIFMADDLGFLSASSDVLRYANQQNVPLISLCPGSADLGGFMTLESDLVEQGRELAGYLKKVLAGAEVQFLAPRRPHNVALVVNLKTSAALKISVPFSVLAETSRVVR